MISAETQSTIIDQFYFIVIFGGFPPPTHVGFDTTKVMVNPDDGQKLWDLTFSHYRKFFAQKQAEQRANEVWERFAPVFEPTLPRGTVRLLDGYIRFA